jgi:hypothetical protein
VHRKPPVALRPTRADLLAATLRASMQRVGLIAAVLT